MCPERLSHPTIHAHHHHCVWDNAIAPVRTVAPGDTLTFEVNDASAGQITPTSTAGVFDDYDGARVNPVTGPIFVDGAEPGDTLIVRLEHYAPSGWGWTAIIPGFGLLADQFQDVYRRIDDQHDFADTGQRTAKPDVLLVSALKHGGDLRLPIEGPPEGELAFAPLPLIDTYITQNRAMAP